MSRVLHSEVASCEDKGRDREECEAEELMVGDINIRIFNNAPDMPLNNADEFCDNLLDCIRLKVKTFG